MSELQYELCFQTNDGWVVSLLTDKPINLRDAEISSIIVQPKEDYAKRAANTPEVVRSLYRIGVKCATCGTAPQPKYDRELVYYGRVWWCPTCANVFYGSLDSGNNSSGEFVWTKGEPPTPSWAVFSYPEQKP